MTRDEKSLLKHGLFWVMTAAGFWFVIRVFHSRVVILVGIMAWMAFFYAIFYRDAQKRDPN